MAFSKKPSLVFVFVMLMLLLTQPAYSKKRKPRRTSPFCKAKCLMYCLKHVNKEGDLRVFHPCVAGCYMKKCGSKAKSLSQPSFQCGVGCVKSKCSNHGDGNGKVSKECVMSCVDNCDRKSIGDKY